MFEPARKELGRAGGAAFAAGGGLSLEAAIAEAMATASHDVGAGGANELSAREREVTKLIGRGYSNRRIATELTVSEATVATHVQHILAKLGLGSRAQIAVWASQHGLLEEPAANGLRRS
jgi:DNA-binding NarL/FixJ family response regulator